MAGILRAIEAFVFNQTAPLSQEEEDEGSGRGQRSAERYKCTVLAIDDDAAFLHILRPVLREQGFNVLSTTSGAKGLDMLRYAQRDVRIVLLDYKMPQLNGEETLQHLRRLSSEIKVLAVTGVDAQLLPPSFCENVDKFIHKPFRNDQLIDAINSLLKNGETPAASAT
jgi:CheY-like chemotaxis protein